MLNTKQSIKNLYSHLNALEVPTVLKDCHFKAFEDICTTE